MKKIAFSLVIGLVVAWSLMMAGCGASSDSKNSDAKDAGIAPSVNLDDYDGLQPGEAELIYKDGSKDLFSNPSSQLFDSDESGLMKLVSTLENASANSVSYKSKYADSVLVSKGKVVAIKERPATTIPWWASRTSTSWGERPFTRKL